METRKVVKFMMAYFAYLDRAEKSAYTEAVRSGTYRVLVNGEEVVHIRDTPPDNASVEIDSTSKIMQITTADGAALVWKESEIVIK